MLGTRTGVVLRLEVWATSANASDKTTPQSIGALMSYSYSSYSRAITSISTSTSFGKRETSTVDRAGGAELKYLP